jgi:hypothetical protein
VAPGETVAVDLASLPPPQPLPRAAAIGFVAAAALLSTMFLIAPLRSSRRSGETAEATTGAVERAAVYAAIRDLEDDFETGKISADDRAEMLSELRARAAELVRRERATTAPLATPAVAAPPTCPQCAAALTAGARFCSHCGARAATAPSLPG